MLIESPTRSAAPAAAATLDVPILSARWSESEIGKGASYRYDHHHVLEAGAVAARFDVLRYKNPDNAVADAIRAARDLSAGGRPAFGVFRKWGLGDIELAPLSVRNRTVTYTTRYDSHIEDIYVTTERANRVEPLRGTAEGWPQIPVGRGWASNSSPRGQLVAVVDGEERLEAIGDEQGTTHFRRREPA